MFNQIKYNSQKEAFRILLTNDRLYQSASHARGSDYQRNKR